MKYTCLKDYYSLYQLLGAWFPDMDYEDKSFKEIIEEYKDASPEARLTLLKLEFDTFFLNDNIDYDEVMETSNLYFENKKEAYDWLHELYGYLFENE